MIVRILSAMLLAFALTTPALAANPDEVLSDPALEERARQISKGLRCVVCQNQSIDDSEAGIARDMRLLVRERLVAGETDAEVRDYLVQRYGEFVLLRPSFGWHTLALWIAPALFVLAGLVVLVRRKAVPATDDRLNAEEEQALQQALSD